MNKKAKVISVCYILALLCNLIAGKLTNELIQFYGDAPESFQDAPSVAAYKVLNPFLALSLVGIGMVIATILAKNKKPDFYSMCIPPALLGSVWGVYSILRYNPVLYTVSDTGSLQAAGSMMPFILIELAIFIVVVLLCASGILSGRKS